MHISMYDAISENIRKIREDVKNVCFIEPNEAERELIPSKHDIVLEVGRLTSAKKLYLEKML